MSQCLAAVSDLTEVSVGRNQASAIKNPLQGDSAFKICIMMSVSSSQVVSILSYSVKD